MKRTTCVFRLSLRERLKVGFGFAVKVTFATFNFDQWYACEQYSDCGQSADWLACLGVCFSKETHMNFLRIFVDYQIIGILKLFTLSQNPSSCLYSIKQIIFSLSNCFCHRCFIAPYGCRFTELMKQSHVWNRGSYICIQVILHIICLTFVNYCKLLNTKTAYFSFIKTKIKLLSLFLFPKVNSP